MSLFKGEGKKKDELQLDGEEKEIGVKIGIFSYARKRIFKRPVGQIDKKADTEKDNRSESSDHSPQETITKPLITIAEILCSYCYKENVQELLAQYGESTSGNKDELISRFLESKKVRSKDVNLIAKEVINGLLANDLRQIGSEYGLNLPNKKDEMSKVILEYFKFEPYLDIKRLPCDFCNSTTKQEIHFKNDWTVDYFQCLTCGLKINPSSRKK